MSIYWPLREVGEEVEKRTRQSPLGLMKIHSQRIIGLEDFWESEIAEIEERAEEEGRRRTLIDSRSLIQSVQ